LTDTARIFPVILCGGAGTRLWPLSRKSYPKQFGPLLPGGSLFQRTLERVHAAPFAPPLLLTTSDFRFLAAEQLSDLGMEATRIVIEPEMRNTAPAVCLAAMMVSEIDPNGLMLVLPSDHIIRGVAAFHDAVAQGAKAASTGHVVTFGVAPTRPETGYGYLELSAPPRTGSAAVAFERFVEKPDLVTAERMLASGRYLWNSGIFLFRASDILAAFEAHGPEVKAACAEALVTGREDLCFFRPGEEAYAANPTISLDYAVMERLDGGVVVPVDCGWNDLGSWRTVWQEAERGQDGLAVMGAAQGIDCADSLLISAEPGLELVGLGLNDAIVVAMRDAVLVSTMDRAQEVGQAVALLRDKGAAQADEHPRFHRPWGWYESLAKAPGFQVKRIMVHPGGKLSLQSHRHRAEHWVVVSGAAQVTVGDTVRALGVNQSCYVPLGERHRLENPGESDLHLIEVQSGDYLGEDDITRYDDVYARDSAAE